MGEPIRWDTIMSRPHSESTAGIGSAAQLINNGIGQLQGTLKSAEDVHQSNFDNHTKLNTAAFQDAVAKYRSPEELKSAMDSGGALDQLRASLGPNINHDAIRGAADARMMGLMQQKQQEIQFNHAMADERVAPLVDKFKSLELAGKHEEAAALEGEYAKLGGRDLAGLAAYRDNRAWTINERGMALNKSNIEDKLANSTINHQRAIESNSAAQTVIQGRQVDNQEKLTRFQIDTGTEDRTLAKAAGMAAALKNSLREGGNMYAEGMYTGNQADELRKFMKDNNLGGGNADKQAEVINYLGEILKKGVEVKGPDGKTITTVRDIPMSAVKQAIGGATNDIFNMGWNTAPAKNMRDALENILSATSKDSNGSLTSKALDDLRTYTDAVQRARDNAPGIKPSGGSYPQPKRK